MRICFLAKWNLRWNTLRLHITLHYPVVYLYTYICVMQLYKWYIPHITYIMFCRAKFNMQVHFEPFIPPFRFNCLFKHIYCILLAICRFGKFALLFISPYKYMYTRLLHGCSFNVRPCWYYLKFYMVIAVECIVRSLMNAERFGQKNQAALKDNINLRIEIKWTYVQRWSYANEYAKHI